uniref:ATP synthase subunit a n=1 Tax=Meghimatium bilineatum TaxID=318265 RepID=A0A344AZ00_9EUPU|nr:ATP synthase F0 subunit 6 [Meghimatium bilineatum]UZH97781.1 ATP synthase F0 subunit 6 [Meghimatium bilineatum]
MMADLFTSLDGMMYNKSWMMMLIMILFLWSNYSYKLMVFPFYSVIKKLWGLGPGLFNYHLLLTSLIVILLVNNFLGLVPFVYGLTSSLWFNLSFALMLWATSLVSGIFFNTKAALAHLVPSGTPLLLIPLLVLIETISNLIRPLTLTVRLMANISAGHIVMALISNLLSALPVSANQAVILLIMVFYMLFEFFVSFIQAYIFTLLISLYINEHP